jgi:hypothetical protein
VKAEAFVKYALMRDVMQYRSSYVSVWRIRKELAAFKRSQRTRERLTR